MASQRLTNCFLATAAVIACNSIIHTASAQTRLSQVPAGSPQVTQGGSAYFTNPPSLGRVAVLGQATYGYGTYRVAITVPPDAGQALSAVQIATDQNLGAVNFDLEQSRAFTTNQNAAETPVPLATVGNTEARLPGAFTIAFAQPIQPGNTVTIDLAARSRLVFTGAYDLGVTAYPQGSNPQGQYIGTGRVNLYAPER